jgi:hypothetical protein
LKYTNKYNLPQSLVDVIVKKTYDLSQTDQYRIGITTLTNSPRVRQLTIRHWNELEDDVSNHLWRITGDAYHYILAKTKQDNRLIEQKIEEKLNDFTIVGKPDLYDDITKSVDDYKITSVWSVKEVKEEHEQQLNCYAWLLYKAGFPVSYAYINAILRDWSEMEMRRFGGSYPPIPFKRISIPLWSFDEQQEFIEKRIKLHKEAVTLKDWELPVCTKKERWATDDKYAIYKNKNKTATRVLGSQEECNLYIAKLNDSKNLYRIDKRTGIDTKCIKYCTCNSVCDYYLKTYGNKK